MAKEEAVAERAAVVGTFILRAVFC
uniref:Uncharacterized protein n=1 Tax=Anguilla anguilla TaxID=7936 RepID=A0A0E9SSS8_ANGAN